MNKKCLATAVVLGFWSASAWALDLVTAYQWAQQNDPTWQAMQYEFEAEQQNLGIARSTLMPTVVLQGAIVRRHQEVDESDSNAQALPFEMDFVQPNTTTKQISLGLRQPLFRLDLWHGYQQAKTAQRLSDVKLRARQQQHILDVSESYFNVLRQQALIQTFQEEEKALQQQLKTMTAKLREGLVARSDVSEADAQYQNARANRIAAGIQLDVARERLTQLIGQYDGELADIRENFEYTPPVPNQVDDWLSLAETHNLNIQQARFNVKVNDQQREIEKTGYYPQIDAVGVVGYNSQSPQTAISSNGQYEQFGVEMNWQLFSGGRTQVSLNKANKQWQQSTAQLDAQLLKVRTDTKSAFHQVNTDQAKLQARKAAMTSSQMVAKASQASYNEGLRSMVDVLLAQRNAFATRQEYVNAQYDYMINVLRLKAVTGVLGEQDLTEINAWLELPKPALVKTNQVRAAKK